jgi:threonine aldolase
MGSVQPQPLDNAPDGSMPLEAIRAAVKPDDPHYARSRLLALENTIGGKVLPMAYVQAATALAREMGLATHLDGARMFNAAVAMGGDPWARAREVAGAFDSVSVCFSKGLGTPSGSMLLGSRDLIARALRVRKMAGGGMRQAGLLAAAALHALDHHVARLGDDHARAARLAAAFDGIPGVTLDPVDTNIVFVNLGPDARAEGFLDHLKAEGILALGLYRLRFVTHLDVDDAGVDRAAAAIRAWFGA